MKDWKSKGFAQAPELQYAPTNGLLLYRAWGGPRSTEWGSGYFSLEKPASVLDAELRFNIADWGNHIHFVSTFKLLSGSPYHVGPVAHGKRDLSRPGSQVYLETPFASKITRVGTFEVLHHDVFVSPKIGTA